MLAYLDTIIAFTVVMLGFSLLITLFNQMISTVLSLRGANLLWGIETMLKTLDPKLADQAEAIGRKILTNPVVSDSICARVRDSRYPVGNRLVRRWKLANAIGPDVLIRGMRDVAGQLKSSDPRTSEALENLIVQVDPEVQRKLTNIREAFQLLAPAPGFAVQVDDYLKQLGNSAQQSVGRVEAWFNIAMNRVSQRFTMKMRILTMIGAFLLAFGIHLDTFTLADRLLGNPALRAQTVAQSTAMLDEAQAIMGEQAAGQSISAVAAPTTSPKVLQAAAKQLIAKNINKDAEGQSGKFDSVPEFSSVAEAEKWISDGLKPEVKPERKAELLSQYRRYAIVGLKDKAKDVAAVLQQTGLELVPGDRKLSDLRNPLKFFFTFSGARNFLGVLLSAGLLALGAPFWYNALKTLTSLRPVVANKQDQVRLQTSS